MSLLYTLCLEWIIYIKYIHPGLRTIQYRSRGREIARALCGWAGRVAYDDGKVAGADNDFSTNEGDQVSLFNGDNSFDADDVVDYNNDLEALVEECEHLDGFERATALALFHGNNISLSSYAWTSFVSYE